MAITDRNPTGAFQVREEALLSQYTENANLAEASRSALVRTLRQLALNACDQIKYLEELGLGNGVDELALEFDDIASRPEELVAAGVIRHETAAVMRKLLEMFDSMSGEGNRRLWTRNALENSKEWNEVRILAADALRLILK